MLEYETDFTQFQSVSSLTLFFPSNFNGYGWTNTTMCMGARRVIHLNVTRVWGAFPDNHCSPRHPLRFIS